MTEPMTLPDTTKTLIPARADGTARIFHTSDWHLGVQVRNEPRGADHDALIDELVAIAAQADPDLIVHTGDLFDGFRPPMPDLDRAIRALRRLAEVAPVALLAGNHDSAGTLQVVATAVDDDIDVQLADGTWSPYSPCRQPVRVLHSIVPPTRGLVATYTGKRGVDVRFAGLPFVHQGRTFTDFGRVLEANATYLDAMRVMVDALTATASAQLDRSRQVMVMASHVHVSGAKVSSERKLSVSDTYAADENQLPADYAYLALGHIHVPQAVAGGRGRYAGSLLEVDFGEEGEAKRVLVVDCAPGRPAEITSVPLTSGRRLRRVSSTIDALADHATDLAGSIAEVTIVSAPGETVPAPGTEPQSLDLTVRSLLPGVDVVQVIDARRRLRGGGATGAGAPMPAPTMSTGDELRAWLGGAGAKRLGAGADTGRVVALFETLATAAAAGDALSLPDLDLLTNLCGDL